MAKHIAELQEQLNWHWRNSMRPLRFFGLDAKSALPLVILIPWPRITTLVLAVAVIAFFVFLEKRGLTFMAAMRSIRGLLFGEKRPALSTFRHRRLKDYG